MRNGAYLCFFNMGAVSKREERVAKSAFYIICPERLSSAEVTEFFFVLLQKRRDEISRKRENRIILEKRYHFKEYI